MARYYLIYSKEINGVVVPFLKRWERVFNKNKDILGFFSEDVFVDLEERIDVANILAKKNRTLEGIYEIVILPIISAPADIEIETEYCRILREKIAAEIRGAGVSGVYVFPLIKRTESGGTGERIIRTSSFIFGPRSLTGAFYRDEDWFDDVESFIRLIPLIESKGLHFFEFFPRILPKSELMSFASKRFYSPEYLATKSFVELSLKNWIERQTVSETDAPPCLIDIKREVEALRGIGAQSPEERSRKWLDVLPRYLRFYEGWSFNFVKEHFKEIKDIRIKTKLCQDIGLAAREIDSFALEEYEAKIQEMKRLERDRYYDFHNEAFAALEAKRTTLNGLLKEIEAKRSEGLGEDGADVKEFSLLIAEQVEAHNTEDFFASIIKDLRDYLRGVPFKKAARIGLGIFTALALLSALFFLSLQIKFSLKFFLGGNAALASVFTIGFIYFLRQLKRRRIEGKLDELKKRIRMGAASAARAGIMGKARLLFDRYAVRKAMSLQRGYWSLRKSLAEIKNSLQEFRNLDMNRLYGTAPFEIRELTDKISWEEAFREIVFWEQNSVKFHFLPKIEDMTKKIFLGKGQKIAVPIDRNAGEIIKSLLTVPFEDTEIAIKILHPGYIDKTPFEYAGSVQYLEYEEEESVTGIVLGRKRLD